MPKTTQIKPRLEFPEWAQLAREAATDEPEVWEEKCRGWAKAASIGELRTSSLDVVKAIRRVKQEDMHIGEDTSYTTTGFGEAYRASATVRIRLALAWIILKDQDLAGLALNPEVELVRGLRVREVVKLGVKWAKQEWEIIHQWGEHPMSPNIWCEEWYYRQAPETTETRKLAKVIIKRTAPDIPQLVSNMAYEADALELHQVLRESLEPRQLLGWVAVAKMFGKGVGNNPVLVLSPEWWESLSKAEKVELFSHGNKVAREIIIGVTGQYKAKEPGTAKQDKDIKRGMKV